MIRVIDNKLRTVKLTKDQIESIILCLEHQDHSLYEFFGNDKIIKKLNEAKER